MKVFGLVPVLKSATSAAELFFLSVALPVQCPEKSYGVICASATTVTASSAMPSAATLVPDPESEVLMQPPPLPPKKNSCAAPYSPNTAFNASPSTKSPPASLLW